MTITKEDIKYTGIKVENVAKGKADWYLFNKLCKSCYLCVAKCPVKCLNPIAEPNKENSELGLFETPVVRPDAEKCIGCGMCARNCPADAISKTDYIAPGHKLPSYVIDTEKCVKCGVCIGNCKFKAIEKK